MVDAPPSAAEPQSQQEVPSRPVEGNLERPTEAEPAGGAVSEAPSQEAEGEPPIDDRSGEEVPTSPATPVPEDRPPEWTTWEDDLSTPTEDEMAEIRLRESRGQELNALDVPSVEKRIYQDVDDPEQRPVKKLRLSWVIKGVRGIREKPNNARVMMSPAAQVDGSYWQIKFYPRGNKSVSLSAYIKCSRHPPKSDIEYPDGSFSFLQGPPDADLRHDVAPSHTVYTQSTASESKNDTSSSSDSASDSSKQDSIDGEGSTDSSQADKEEPLDIKSAEGEEEAEDWRVPAQLGMVMYNPEEPRTCHVMSSEHQFAQSNDDWGWTNFVGPWSEVQTRGHLQRAPLLRNDTIAIDAYIRIFDDPTQALWWHSSDAENHWDSKSLTGYFPMGTPPLYHSPAVAGMTAWLLLAPFRKILQEVDTGDGRQNPKPFISQLQMILNLMRHLKKERETYVDVYPAIQTLKELGEVYTDVKTFWEVFRRTIDLELKGTHFSKSLPAMFDTPDGPMSLPSLPVGEGVNDIQQGLAQVLHDKSFSGQLPDFLPLSLARERFDTKSREWKLLHNRVSLNETLDMSDFSLSNDHAKYTLYGFMVHVGERNSGKFYTVLRPGGPGTKWLAFEDGDGNKVFSYTKKRIRSFEGLEGQALKDFSSTRETAYMVMYIKTSRLGEYLTGKLEPYNSVHPHSEFHGSGGASAPESLPAESLPAESLPADPRQVTVELYSDECTIGREGLLDVFDLKRHAQEQRMCYYTMSVPEGSTYRDLRQRLAEELEIDDENQLRLFTLSSTGLEHHLRTCLRRPIDLNVSLRYNARFDEPRCLWFAVLKNESDVELFGHHDRPLPEEVMEEGGQSQASRQEDGADEQLSDADAEQASIQAAVAADIARMPATSEQPVSQVTEMQDPDTPMQMDIPPPTAEESLHANVPHGHLIDAAAHDGPRAMEITTGNDDTQESSAEPGSTLSSLEQDIIADAIARATGPGEPLVDISAYYSTVPVPDRAEASTESSQSAQAARGPPENVYGCLQVFDVERQSFQVRETFFARCDEKIKPFVQQRMGFTADQAFNVWYRDSAAHGCSIASGDTFQDRDLPDGCELIVGEQISESEVKSLHKEGKFSDPFELSQYLLMVDRQHPVRSLTTTEPIELADFGTDYYKGPLVNGRKHGEDCLWISSGGNMYQGPLMCNKKCGKGGRMTYRNGDTYEGNWDEDERHGHGTFVEKRTGNKYVGGFEYGKRWGMGTTYWQVADEQADLCQICCEQDIDALFFDCGHVCSCVECAKQCEICPICRKTVKQVVKMFRA
ncbi:ubiquitin thiolesterase [Exophiala viscosa]|uniref:Ubiquitin thiolesterase n=2 Tax=Exophiala viscosa TaxID=2486360 RepID=A0AAN6I891_9EURO|nr:ubiquitin thiolesterase [Exophiala viscosa]